MACGRQHGNEIAASVVTQITPFRFSPISGARRVAFLPRPLIALGKSANL
jgi:hypothetical protein